MKQMKFSMFRKGKYSKFDRNFPNLRFIEILCEDKTNKLSVSNHTIYSADKVRRLVASTQALFTALNIYKRLELMKHPTQEYIFCRPASETRLKEFETNGLTTVKLDPARPYGRNSVNLVSLFIFILYWLNCNTNYILLL